MAGRVHWTPPEVTAELERIKRRKKIHSNSEAMRHMADYSKIGREVENIINLDFSDSPIIKLRRRRK